MSTFEGGLQGGLCIWMSIVITDEYYSPYNPDTFNRLSVDQVYLQFVLGSPNSNLTFSYATNSVHLYTLVMLELRYAL